MFSRWGVPIELRTDEGPQFTSKFFFNSLVIINMVLFMSIPLNPASNGHAERGGWGQIRIFIFIFICVFVFEFPVLVFDFLKRPAFVFVFHPCI